MSNAQKDFEDYLEKYCKTYKVSPEEAQKHNLVEEVKHYYEDLYAGKVQ